MRECECGNAGCRGEREPDYARMMTATADDDEGTRTCSKTCGLLYRPQRFGVFGKRWRKRSSCETCFVG